jgi:uridine kinase
VERLLRRESITVPNYNYKTCKREEPGILLRATDILLMEGIFGLYDATLRLKMDLKLFVHSDDDIRLLRRLKRDVMERGRTPEGVIKSYNRFVKASYDEYIKPVCSLLIKSYQDYEILRPHSTARC